MSVLNVILKGIIVVIVLLFFILNIFKFVKNVIVWLLNVDSCLIVFFLVWGLFKIVLLNIVIWLEFMIKFLLKCFIVLWVFCLFKCVINCLGVLVLKGVLLIFGEKFLKGRLNLVNNCCLNGEFDVNISVGFIINFGWKLYFVKDKLYWIWK